MDLFKAIRQRRCVRELDPVQIPADDLRKIVQAGIDAPSGRNQQPREFIVITDPNLIRQMAAVQSFIAQASAVIAVVCDPGQSDYWLEDASASAQNMLLAITALGYASCWVEGTLLRREQEMKSLLDIPKDKRLIVFLPIGKAKTPGQAAQKKTFTELVYYNRYGKEFSLKD
ncbi:MAG: nitroreductase family protein [Planctomycetota bacterium]